MSPLTVQLLAALLCAIIGFTAGVLVTLLWSEKEKKIAGQAEVEENQVDKSREEVARIWRDKKTGALQTEVGGKIYRDESELSKSQRVELKYAAMSWAGWVLGNEEELKTPTAAPAVVLASPQPLPPVPAPPVKVPPPDPKAEKGGDKKGKVEEPPKPKTMVEEIDEILAEQIKGTPLENRGLRIVQDNVGVVVWVGLDHYEGIDGVTDPEIKEALKTAVQTWEKRTEAKK
jgi:hypothetical protein